MARPPSRAPTPMATGRLRPVLVRAGVDADSVTSSGGPDASCLRCKLDLEELGFLVLEQLVHLTHVAVSQLFELALGAAAVILARLAGLDQLVDRVLGVAADVADGDPAVLGLGPGHLDVLLAALLGQVGEHDPD